MASEAEARDLFEQHVLPVIFADGPTPGGDALFVLVTAQGGAGAGRAAGRVVADHQGLVPLSVDALRPFHPRFQEAQSLPGSDADREVSDAAALWLSWSLAYAREHKRSVLLEGTFDLPSTALGLLGRFSDDGFLTRVVVVGVPRRRSLLSEASIHAHLLREGGWPQGTSVDGHDRGVAGTRALVSALELEVPVDELTVVDDRGARVFDARRADPGGFRGARAALTAAQEEPVTAYRAAEWLGELRRVTEFAASRRFRDESLTESLVVLHELALQEVTPHLPVPAGSDVVPVQEHRLANSLVELRAASARQQPARVDAPIVAPVTPERGGVSR